MISEFFSYKVNFKLKHLSNLAGLSLLSKCVILRVFYAEKIMEFPGSAMSVYYEAIFLIVFFALVL